MRNLHPGQKNPNKQTGGGTKTNLYAPTLLGSGDKKLYKITFKSWMSKLQPGQEVRPKSGNGHYDFDF